MSYLALYASPFDENNEINSGDDIDKKRQARNKTLKKRPTNNTIDSHVQNMIKTIHESTGHSSNGSGGISGHNSDDDGLADFNPPAHAEITRTKQPATAAAAASNMNSNDNGNTLGSAPYPYASPYNDANSVRPQNTNIVQPSHMQQQQPRPVQEPIQDGGVSKEAFNTLYTTSNSENSYHKQYIPYYTQLNQTADLANKQGHKDQLLEKLNYMIHLLEDQQNERTGHVMEELILYSFLGIFIIFIVDSFARSGTYKR